MVLEATTDPSSDFTPDIPPSDFPSPDSDGNSNRLEAKYNLDISSLPHANFISASLFGHTEARLRNLIALNISAAAQRLRRMPTPDEFKALAYHTAKAQAIASYGAPLGIFGGAVQCYAVRENYKFPFVKPSEGFNPNTFTLRGRTWLAGERARLFWHGLRFAAYGSFGGWIGGICCAAYASSVMAVGELTDPRLKALQELIKREAKEAMERTRAGQGQGQTKKVDVTGQGDKSTGELWRRHRTSIGANDTQADDASPSAGQQEMEFAQSMAVEERLYGTDNGKRMGRAGAGQTTSPPPTKQTAWNRAAARAKTNTPDSEPSTAGGFYDNYDDASPTAMDAQSATSTNSASGGSAWERIRREAAAKEPSSRSRRARGVQQQTSQGGDGGGIDDRERAQREFDAQLERERQGGSFGGSSRGREW
ncbi:hypothetical protein MMC30_006158 [Trapelia coarctata]|nr:hypothetical protein [Trapelia coarctata]